MTGATAWDRFASYVFALGENQAGDPAFNDVVSRRYPEAAALRDVCDRAVDYGVVLARAAQADGSLRADDSPLDRPDGYLVQLAWRDPFGDPVIVNKTIDRMIERLGAGPFLRRYDDSYDDGFALNGNACCATHPSGM